MTKDMMRKQTLKIRNNLTKAEVADAQERIDHNILLAISSLNLNGASCVMAYMDFRNEVSTKTLLQYLFDHHIRVVLPYTKENQLYPFFVNDLKTLKQDSFGILVPDPVICQPANPAEIPFIFMPGIVFDETGNRIGFGKGYYDKFLPSAKNACTIALCYEFQIVKEISTSPFDIPVDYIITEKRLITCSDKSDSCKKE